MPKTVKGSSKGDRHAKLYANFGSMLNLFGRRIPTNNPNSVAWKNNVLICLAFMYEHYMSSMADSYFADDMYGTAYRWVLRIVSTVDEGKMKGEIREDIDDDEESKEGEGEEEGEDDNDDGVDDDDDGDDEGEISSSGLLSDDSSVDGSDRKMPASNRQLSDYMEEDEFDMDVNDVSPGPICVSDISRIVTSKMKLNDLGGGVRLYCQFRDYKINKDGGAEPKKLKKDSSAEVKSDGGVWRDMYYIDKSPYDEKGVGLFAARQMAKGFTIGFYVGEVTDDPASSKHCIRIRCSNGTQVLIDCGRKNTLGDDIPLNLGMHFINDASHSFKKSNQAAVEKMQGRNNVAIYDDGTVVATKKIQIGDELLATYYPKKESIKEDVAVIGALSRAAEQLAALRDVGTTQNKVNKRKKNG